MFTVDQDVYVVKTEPLEGNDVAPDLVMGEKKTIYKIILDREGNQHLDVGLQSHYGYIRSFETKEELPEGNIIHWCHPSRFSTEPPKNSEDDTK